MRLIDADSIRFKPYYDEYVDYDGYINDLKTWQLDDILSDRVDNTPTVKAIPIEWIKRYIAEEGIYPNRELLSVEQADAIERMIENWEKENE